MSVPSESLLDEHRNRGIVDCFRAAGILLVILFHSVFGVTTLLDEGSAERTALIADFPKILNIAWQALGSEVIFLCSGFLLSYLLLRDFETRGYVDVGDFWLRRLARIVPLYALAIVIYAPFANVDRSELVLNLLFVSKIFGADTIIPVGWSLELLVQTYLLLPFAVFLVVKSRRPIGVLVAALAASLALRYLALSADAHNYQPLHGIIAGDSATAVQQDLYYLLWYRASPFLLGFGLALAVTRRHEHLGRLFARPLWAASTAATGLLLIGASAWLPLHDPASALHRFAGETFWLWYFTLQRFVFGCGLCLMLLYLWYARAPRLARLNGVFASRAARTVAGDIYPLYLFHIALLVPAAVVVFRTVSEDEIGAVHPLEVLAVFVVCAVLSIAVARALGRYVESPARDWLKRRLGAMRGRIVLGASMSTPTAAAHQASATSSSSATRTAAARSCRAGRK